MIDASAQERDQRLWDRWRSGDPESGAELLGLYEAALHAALRRMGVREPETREEIYAEVVLNLVEYNRKNSLQSSFFGLARKMAVARVLRHRDPKRRQQPLSSLAPEDEGPVVVDPVADSNSRIVDLLDTLEHCLQLLHHPFEKEVFLRRFFDHRDHVELAEEYGKSRNHIAVVLHRALKAIRGCVAAQGFPI